jgi:hypothetical protein
MGSRSRPSCERSHVPLAQPQVPCQHNRARCNAVSQIGEAVDLSAWSSTASCFDTFMYSETQMRLISIAFSGGSGTIHAGHWKEVTQIRAARRAAMNYVGFFAALIPFQVCLVVTSVWLVRRKTLPNERMSWLQLLGRIFVLMFFVDLVSILPVVGVASVVIWLVALKRLSGLDVLSTALFGASLGAVCFAATIILAKYFQVAVGQQFSQ